MTEENGVRKVNTWLVHLVQALGFLILGYVVASMHSNSTEIGNNRRGLAVTSERIARVEAYVELDREKNDEILEALKEIRAELREHSKVPHNP